MRSPNFLILDEPTNDLDIVTLGILEDYLRNFNGCLIIISHDRFFLDSTVDHLFVFQGDGVVKDFPGTYSEYRDFINEQSKVGRESQTSTSAQQPSSGKVKSQQPRRLSFKEKKELEALTGEIETLNDEKSHLEKIFSGEAEGDFNEASRRYDEIKNLLDEKELRWLELSEFE